MTVCPAKRESGCNLDQMQASKGGRGSKCSRLCKQQCDVGDNEPKKIKD